MTEQLSPLDVAFLALEGNSNPMHLGAVTIFAPTRPVHPARIVALLCERAQEIPRLSQRAQTSWLPLGGASWVDDPGFAPEDHVFPHHLRGRGEPKTCSQGRASTQRRFPSLVSHLMAQPLDLDRPPWKMHVVTGLAGGRFAVIMKMHHSLCDGMKAVGLGLRLLDDNRLTELSPAPGKPWSFPRPEELLRGVRDTLGIASSVLRSTRPPARHSPVLTMSSRPKQVVMARLDAGEVQRIRKHHGGTVNDVLLALVTGALRQWLGAHDSAGRGTTVRALIPVSQRGRGGDQAGNKISGFLCELPVGEPDPVVRLRAVRDDMDRNKSAGPGRGPGALPLLADRLPSLVHRITAPVAGRCAPLLFDTLVTSVHLPSVPLTLDGAELLEMYPVAPVAPGHSIGVALSAYRSGIHVCLHTNQSWMSDSRWLDGALRRELAALAPREFAKTPVRAHQEA